MNRLLLGTSLLLTAGSWGQTSYAAPTYTATAVILSPKGDYTAQYGYGQTAIPFSLNQHVDVDGAAPMTFIPVGWTMTAQFTWHYGARSGVIPVDSDASGATVAGYADASGHFTRNILGIQTGIYTTQFNRPIGGSGDVLVTSIITDANGQQYPVIRGSNFTVTGII